MKHSGRSGHNAPRSDGSTLRRPPSEEPDYSDGIRPEKPGLRNGAGGTTKYGDPMHGSYKQPWVDRDGVIDHNGDSQEG